MAKVGEGDARWIVQERADGTNVHGWHWQERDVLKWSQTRLTELLTDQNLLAGEGQAFITITSVDSVSGEALINNRKKKLIPSYELAVKGSWKGEIKDGSGTTAASASGSYQLPYISDENADEDPELTISLAEEGSSQQRVKQAFVSNGKKARQQQIAALISVLGINQSLPTQQASRLCLQPEQQNYTSACQPAAEVHHDHCQKQPTRPCRLQP